GFQVAMDYQVGVRVLDGSTNGAEQLQALGGRERRLRAVIEQRPALDKLHRQVWRSRLRRAAVQQPRDIGVLQARQDLALGAEPAQHRLRIHSAFDYLDGDLF